MRSFVFQDAVESSAKVFGRKEDVRVIFEGSEAHTDGNTIVLPALPPAADINADQADIIRGFRDHESMHVRCTDTSKKSLEALTNMTQEADVLGKIVQYCEDIRIEHAGVQEYAGMKSTLTATNTEAARILLTQLEQIGKPEDILPTLDNDTKFTFMIQAMGRKSIGVESSGVFEAMCETLKASDPALHSLATKAAQRMVDLPTGYKGGKLNEAAAKKATWSTYDLAREIYNEYQAVATQQPPQPQQQEEEDDKPQPGQPGNGDGSDGDGDGDDQGDGSQGSGNANGKGGGKGKPNGNSNSGGDEEDGEAGGSGQEDEDEDGGDGDDQGGGSNGGGSQQSQSQGQPNGSGGQQGQQQNQSAGKQQVGKTGNSGSGSTGSGNNQFAMSEALKQAINNGYNAALQQTVQAVQEDKEQLGKVVRKSSYRKYSNRLSLSIPYIEYVLAVANRLGNSSELASYIKKGEYAMQDIEKTITGKRAMIRRLLELELQARDDRRWESGFKSGRLQSVRLVQALQGRESVFQRREGGKDMNTLLYISIDGSDSMTIGKRMFSAMSLAYALCEALERTGCEIIVSVWGNTAVTNGRHPKSKYSGKELHDIRNAAGADQYGRIMNRQSTDGPDTLGLITRGVVKSKNQRCTDAIVRASFGLATDAMACSTPTYDAVYEDLADLAKEQHAKKIYLHLTDGEPDCTSSEFTNGRHDHALRKRIMTEAHEVANSIGVHMIGVGISKCKVGHLFPDHIVVDGVDAYEPVIKRLAKLVAQESGHAAHFKRAA